jgi:hypothetical protein
MAASRTHETLSAAGWRGHWGWRQSADTPPGPGWWSLSPIDGLISPEGVGKVAATRDPSGHTFGGRCSGSPGAFLVRAGGGDTIGFPRTACSQTICTV